jgi:hypothetical protein
LVALTLLMMTFLAPLIWKLTLVTLIEVRKGGERGKDLPVLLAVSTAAVQFSEISDGEAIDGDGTNTVVLDNLVGSTTSTTTDDLAVTVTLEGQSILANSIPPDILNGASTETVNTLVLVFTNDGVLEGSAVSEKEDSVSVTAFGLTTALDTTAVGLVATVEGAGDGLGSLVGDGALAGRDGEGRGSTSAEGTHALSSGEGEEAGEDDGGVEMHDCWWSVELFSVKRGC